MSVFGKAKFGGTSRTWFKLKDGESTYRILPPMGNLGEDGKWSVFYSIHYGYRNSKDEMRTFQSPLVKNNKTKMIEVPDAALARIDQLKAKLDEAKKAGNKELQEQLLKLVGGTKSRYNLDSHHYLNVIDLQGNIGILKLRHRAKTALDATIKKLRDAGVDPLDPETGRYFTFSRSGMGLDTLFQVSVYKKKMVIQGVGEVEQEVVHSIDDDLARRCLVVNKDGSYTYKEAARLDTLFKRPTSEEVSRIVLEGAKAVDEILDTKATANVSEVTSEDAEAFEEPTQPTSLSSDGNGGAGTTVAAVTPVPVQTTGYVQTAPVTPSVEAVLAAQTNVAAVFAAAPVPVSKSVAPKTTAQSVAEQTDEEFLKQLGL